MALPKLTDADDASLTRLIEDEIKTSTKGIKATTDLAASITSLSLDIKNTLKQMQVAYKLDALRFAADKKYYKAWGDYVKDWKKTLGDIKKNPIATIAQGLFGKNSLIGTVAQRSIEKKNYVDNKMKAAGTTDPADKAKFKKLFEDEQEILGSLKRISEQMAENKANGFEDVNLKKQQDDEITKLENISPELKKMKDSADADIGGEVSKALDEFVNKLNGNPKNTEGVGAAPIASIDFKELIAATRANMVLTNDTILLGSDLITEEIRKCCEVGSKPKLATPGGAAAEEAAAEQTALFTAQNDLLKAIYGAVSANDEEPKKEEDKKGFFSELFSSIFGPKFLAMLVSGFGTVMASLGGMLTSLLSALGPALALAGAAYVGFKAGQKIFQATGTLNEDGSLSQDSWLAKMNDSLTGVDDVKMTTTAGDIAAYKKVRDAEKKKKTDELQKNADTVNKGFEKTNQAKRAVVDGGKIIIVDTWDVDADGKPVKMGTVTITPTNVAPVQASSAQTVDTTSKQVAAAKDQPIQATNQVVSSVNNSKSSTNIVQQPASPYKPPSWNPIGGVAF